MNTLQEKETATNIFQIITENIVRATNTRSLRIELIEEPLDENFFFSCAFISTKGKLTYQFFRLSDDDEQSLTKIGVYEKHMSSHAGKAIQLDEITSFSHLESDIVKGCCSIIVSFLLANLSHN